DTHAQRLPSATSGRPLRPHAAGVAAQEGQDRQGQEDANEEAGPAPGVAGDAVEAEGGREGGEGQECHGESEHDGPRVEGEGGCPAAGGAEEGGEGAGEVRR